MQSYSIKRQHNGLLSFKKGHFSVKRSILGRALTKTFIHMPFVGTVMPKNHCANKRKT